MTNARHEPLSDAGVAAVRAAMAEAARMVGAAATDEELDAAARIATTPGIDRDEAAARFEAECPALFDGVKRMLMRHHAPWR